jgi:hypothetical protein
MTILPGGKIPEDAYRLVTSLDSINISKVVDSIKGPTAFTFITDDKESSQGIAIKRKHDWLILDWTLFRLSAPARLKLSWIDMDGKGSPELMLSLERSDTMKQELASKEDPMGETAYVTNSQWSTAEGFCIIDIDGMSFLVDNVFTGYEYSYTVSEYFKGKPEKAGGRLVYLESGSKNKRKKLFKVWYTFDIRPHKKVILVRLKQCEEIVTFDPSATYFNKKEKNEKPRPRIIHKSPTCTQMYDEGTYTLKDGRFVKM